MPNCNNNKAYFTQSNKNNHVTIGTFFYRNIRVDVTDNGVTTARDYTNITLSGCIEAKDADNNLLEIPLAQVGDDITTGIYKVDAFNWQFILKETTTATVAPGIYNFSVFGVPADTKKYLELSGQIEFREVAEC